MNLIDLEAHFFTHEYVEYLRARKEAPRLETVRDEQKGRFDRLWFGDDLWVSRQSTLGPLLEVGEGRIRDMDAAGISMQVLSLGGPGCELFDVSDGIVMARKTNDELSGLIKKHPGRFIGLAALPLQNPAGAANELERAVKELSLKGAKVNSNVAGKYLDDKEFIPVLETAERLGVPIYIHPRLPPADMLKFYKGYGYGLAGPGLGFAADTALHAMRLILSGAFDRYPKLKIILGHLGEGLPFWLKRIDASWARGAGEKAIRKKPSEYLRQNFWITVSGMFFEPAFLCVYLALGADRITFASDYPFEKCKQAVEFIEKLPICETDKKKVMYLNARKLFNLH